MKRINFTDSNISDLPTTEKKYEAYDSKLPGLCVRVEGSGRKTFYFLYSVRCRTRWYRIGPAEMSAVEARKVARELIGEVARGRDPQAERRAARGGSTFEALHARYLDEHAKKHNKSWKQADNLIKRYVLSRWAKVTPRRSAAPTSSGSWVTSPQTAPSWPIRFPPPSAPVFTFGVKEEVLSVNPCKGVDGNSTNDRDRALSDAEVVQFRNACEQHIDPVRSAALRTILLTGQRPGEVACMRREHIKGQWLEMPGKPVAELKWPGTKNGASHRVFLPEKVLELIGDHAGAGFVLANTRGNAMKDLATTMNELSKLCSFVTAVTPHDVRRTMGSTITARGHGREAMDRILNHRKKSVTDVYDRHAYAPADQKIMQDVSAHLIRLVEGKSEDNVIAAAYRKAK